MQQPAVMALLVVCRKGIGPKPFTSYWIFPCGNNEKFWVYPCFRIQNLPTMQRIGPYNMDQVKEEPTKIIRLICHNYYQPPPPPQLCLPSLFKVWNNIRYKFCRMLNDDVTETQKSTYTILA